MTSTIRSAIEFTFANCIGLHAEITIYNPCLDEDGSAGRRLAELVAEALGTAAR